jgi:hypothetical protein
VPEKTTRSAAAKLVREELVQLEDTCRGCGEPTADLDDSDDASRRVCSSCLARVSDEARQVGSFQRVYGELASAYADELGRGSVAHDRARLACASFVPLHIERARLGHERRPLAEVFAAAWAGTTGTPGAAE